MTEEEFTTTELETEIKLLKNALLSVPIIPRMPWKRVSGRNLKLYDSLTSKWLKTNSKLMQRLAEEKAKKLF